MKKKEEEPEDTYITPSGVQVTIVDRTTHDFYIMSNGAIIDQEILDKWKVHTKGE